MEFKVIFLGFALHSVLNLVLISKTFLGGEAIFGDDASAQAEEAQMLTEVSSDENGPLVRIGKSEEQKLFLAE